MAKQKRPRQIIIDSVHYLWVVRRLDANYVTLRVWAAARSRRDFPLEVRLRYDDPWLNYGPIITAPPERQAAFQLAPVQPALVRQIVDAAIRLGWDPFNPAEQRHYVWDGMGMLKPLIDQGELQQPEGGTTLA